MMDIDQNAILHKKTNEKSKQRNGCSLRLGGIG